MAISKKDKETTSDTQQTENDELESMLAGADEADAILGDMPTEQEKQESPEEANRRLTEILNGLDPKLPNPPGISNKPKLDKKLIRGPVPGHPDMKTAYRNAALDSNIQNINNVLQQGQTMPAAAISHGQEVLIPADVRDIPNKLHCDPKTQEMARNLVNAIFGCHVEMAFEKDAFDRVVERETLGGLGPAVQMLAGKSGFSEKPWVFISSKLYELQKVDAADVHHDSYDSPYDEAIDDDMGNGLHRALQMVFSRETVRDLQMRARYENVSTIDALRAIFANLIRAHAKQQVKVGGVR